ncbi:MAG: CbtA family protein [Mycolicibacterium sp.]|nr:CbtA family protein [Mycolicibacterium sp.]
MEKKIIGLGLLAGALAGSASFLYARTQIAPLIAEAISYEEARSHAAAGAGGEHAHEHEVFSRAVQENIGAGVGTIMFAIITGALFAVAVSIALATLQRHRITADPRLVAVLVAAAGFVTVAVVPWVAYPANLPGVGQAESAGERTTAYLAVIIASVALAAVAGTAALRLAPRLGGWAAAVTGCVGYLAAISAVIIALPSFHETPSAITDSDGTLLFPGFPADLLADFRTNALICQALLWFVIAGSYAVLLPRAVSAGRATTIGGDVHAHR